MNLNRPGAPRNIRHLRRKEIVLQEDTMRNCVEKIIQRDYFPDLHKLEELKKYLNLQNNSSKSGMKYIPSVLAKATPMMDEYDPVQRIMTKALNIGEGAAVTEDDKKNDELIKGMNLDQFLTKYTSEDNSTFMKLQAEDQRKLREKIAWVYDQAERANKLNQLAIESGGKGEVHIIEYDRVKPINAEVKPLAIEFSHGEGKVTQNQVAISKNTKLRTQIEDNKVKAPAMQVCNSEAKPNLFFTPDEHFLPTLSLEDIEDRQGPDKEIKKCNTRLPTEFYVNFLKEKNQKNVVKEINMDESVLKYGSNSKLKSNVINGYKLIKKEGDDIDVIANKNKPFDPQIALLKLK